MTVVLKLDPYETGPLRSSTSTDPGILSTMILYITSFPIRELVHAIIWRRFPACDVERSLRSGFFPLGHGCMCKQAFS